jgi:glycerol kinase
MRLKRSILPLVPLKWLRDGLQIIGDAVAETQALAESADPHQNVVVVPAFVGLRALLEPHCLGRSTRSTVLQKWLRFRALKA